MDRDAAIGFFDSGLGGLSVLAAARRQLPHENFIYFGDSANAPYGTRADAEVLALTQAVTDRLAAQGIKALVLACNTATSAAARQLRSQYPFPVVGMEPALKVAHDHYKEGTILVMATPLTLRSSKYLLLKEKYGQHAQPLPCPGLMDFVEREEMDSPALHHYLERLFEPFRDTVVDSVVLGCTHYLFIKEAIGQHLPATTRILDSNQGVARQLHTVLQDRQLLSNRHTTGKVHLHTSGDQQKAAQMHRMWALAQNLF